MIGRRPLPVILIAGCLALARPLAGQEGAPAAVGEPPSGAAASASRWTDADGKPLPFRSDEELLEFLRAAEVKSEERLSSGVTFPTKLLLEKDGVRAHAIFRDVVTNGTGAGLADVPGKPVIAKTGTAEFDRNGKRLTHAWMIAAQGDLAVAVYVDEGKTGAATAGPILEGFLRGAHQK